LASNNEIEITSTKWWQLMYFFVSDYDPRLKELVARAKDTSLFRDMGIPYFTLRNRTRRGKDNMQQS